jgi:hypothetical protein
MCWVLPERNGSCDGEARPTGGDLLAVLTRHLRGSGPGEAVIQSSPVRRLPDCLWSSPATQKGEQKLWRRELDP